MELYKRQKENLRNVKREYVVLSLAENLFLLSLVLTQNIQKLEKLFVIKLCGKLFSF